MKLGERLEALLERLKNGNVIALQCMEFIRDHGPALAELARRMEDGHDVLVTHWEQAAFAVAGKPVPRIGSIVRLVPEAGQGGGGG